MPITHTELTEQIKRIRRALDRAVLRVQEAQMEEESDRHDTAFDLLLQAHAKVHRAEMIYRNPPRG